jgi:hypothetical protein
MTEQTMTAAPPPSSVKLETTDWTEVRLILHVMIDAQKAAPKSRERALVITKLEEARMWANEALMIE